MIKPVVILVSEMEEISLPLVREGVMVAAVLNSHPEGAVNVKVLDVPAVKSELTPSDITIFPNVVHAGVVAFAARSAEIVPPVAVVIVTAASVRIEIPMNKITAGINVLTNRIVECLFTKRVFLISL